MPVLICHSYYTPVFRLFLDPLRGSRRPITFLDPSSPLLTSALRRVCCLLPEHKDTEFLSYPHRLRILHNKEYTLLFCHLPRPGLPSHSASTGFSTLDHGIPAFHFQNG